MTSLNRFVILTLLVTTITGGTALASSWESVGPYGGHAQKIVMDPTNRDHLFTMTKNGQIYHSLDAGQRWTRLPFSLTAASSLAAFVVNPNDPKELYIGVARNFANSDTAGVFQSRDGGLHWTQLEPTREFSVLSLAIHPTKTNIVIAGTDKGVLRSNDAGATWKQISPANHPKIKAIGSVAIDPRNPDILYVGTTHLPWKTTDGGVTWQPIHLGMADDSDVFSIVINPVNTQQVLVGVCGGIYRSESGGARWLATSGIPEDSRRTYEIIQDPGNPQAFYAATTQGLWKSLDSGQTWKLANPYPYIINSLVIDPRDPATIYLATDRSGLLKSIDGGSTFLPTNGGFVNRNMVRLFGEDALYVTSNYDGDFGGVFTTTDRGGTWALSANQDDLKGKNIISLAVSPHDVFQMLAGTYDGLLQSADGGKTWQFDDSIPRANRVTGKIYDIAYSESGAGTVFAATDRGLFKSADAGKTWVRNLAVVLNTTVFKVALHPTNSRLILAQTERGVWISRDGGVLWSSVDMGPGNRVFDVAFSFADSSIFAATSEGLLFSRDDGTSWRAVEHGLPARRLDQLLLMRNKPNEIYVMRRDSREIWWSPNMGSEWHRVETRGLEGTSLVSLNIVAGQAFIVTENDGVFRLETQKTPQSATR
jgi:photosystem II stability/assembly factor-like uncharacterized protein